jgi:glyoxylase-like metal-dependent hydrolase (beta-lactamase superfamily II)
MIDGISIERVLAPNPGPFTGPGTNTWVVGDDMSAVVLDPGPVISEHMAAILDVVGNRRVSTVIVTHTHIDHAPLANPLATEVGAPAVGYAAGEEFDPDDVVSDGSVIDVAGRPLTVVHTPGHSDDHLCFRLGTALFTGDHIMGGSSVMVEDMGPYLASLEKIHHTGLTDLFPGHGEPMNEPDQVISWYLAHRMQRERQIVDALGDGAVTVGGIVEVVYAEVDTALHSLAARSVVAHLRKLASDGVAHFDGDDWDAVVRILGSPSGD